MGVGAGTGGVTGSCLAAAAGEPTGAAGEALATVTAGEKGASAAAEVATGVADFDMAGLLLALGDGEDPSAALACQQRHV